jgi:hypothetical protein
MGGAGIKPGPNDPFLVVRICVDGQGLAWFDDVMLEEVRDKQTEVQSATRAGD